MLGSVKGKRVVELGAGIGRFTGALASAGAANVLAVDFMEHLVAENRRANGHWCTASYQMLFSACRRSFGWLKAMAFTIAPQLRPSLCRLHLAYLVQACP